MNADSFFQFLSEEQRKRIQKHPDAKEDAKRIAVALTDLQKLSLKAKYKLERLRLERQDCPTVEKMINTLSSAEWAEFHDVVALLAEEAKSNIGAQLLIDVYCKPWPLPDKIIGRVWVEATDPRDLYDALSKFAGRTHS